MPRRARRGRGPRGGELCAVHVINAVRLARTNTAGRIHRKAVEWTVPASEWFEIIADMSPVLRNSRRSEASGELRAVHDREEARVLHNRGTAEERRPLYSEANQVERNADIPESSPSHSDTILLPSGATVPRAGAAIKVGTGAPVLDAERGWEPGSERGLEPGPPVLDAERGWEPGSERGPEPGPP